MVHIPASGCECGTGRRTDPVATSFPAHSHNLCRKRHRKELAVAPLMLVSYHTALFVAAAAQALQTLAATARSLRGRSRKMSPKTSSGSFSISSTMVWLEGRGLPLPAAVTRVQEGVPELREVDRFLKCQCLCTPRRHCYRLVEKAEIPGCEMAQQIKVLGPQHR